LSFIAVVDFVTPTEVSTSHSLPGPQWEDGELHRLTIWNSFGRAGEFKIPAFKCGPWSNNKCSLNGQYCLKNHPGSDSEKFSIK